MNLPFGEGSYYDKTKYNSIKQELIWLFKYEEIFISEKKEKYKEFEVCEIRFIWGLVKIIFYYEKNHLFLPSFQVDLFQNSFPLTKGQGELSFAQERDALGLKDAWKADRDNLSFLNKFYEIFTNIWWEDYIFDLISKKLEIKNSKILTDYKLANYFKTFSEKKLENFLTNLDKFFIEEKLEQNREMKYHLYYLIFLNYKLFKNILLSDWWIKKLEKFLWEDIDDKFMQELFLSKERIEHISNINLVVFEKYKILLENFMKLLK